MSVEQNKLVARRVHEEIFLKGDLAVADEIFAPNAKFHGPDWPTGATGPEVIKEDARIYRSAFRIERLSRDGEVCEGDMVVHRWTFTGTHVGDLGGIKPTGRTVTGEGIDVIRVQDGKITELWQQWDQMGVMQQLGVVPSMEPAAT